MSTCNENLSKTDIQRIVREMLEDSAEDLDAFIEEHSEEYPDDLAEYTFRLAVQTGNIEYVEEHIDDIELNDEGGSSSYLEDAANEEMKSLLMDHGAYYSWDHYSDCQFATETVNNTIIAFSESFQKEVYEKYKEMFGLEDDSIRKIIEEGFDEDDDDVAYADRDIEDDMRLLGVSFEDDEISFLDKTDLENCDEEGYDLKELLEELGWDCDFEGDSWKFETTGVYFIE